MFIAFEVSGDGEKGMGEQGQGDPAMPGVPAAHLVLVQPITCWSAATAPPAPPVTGTRASTAPSTDQVDSDLGSPHNRR